MERQKIRFGNTTIIVTFNARIAWWVRPYLKTVWLIAQITQLEPDMKRVTRRVMRGVRAKTVERPSH
ncbi:hypothetical protein [Paraburkholderia bannensis]|uniref:hypothetical protein n=1 Tax=Paraburkholderia bannensis TaxID=765414 RepID=UPI00048667D2|nr:hypothetical protein [Paraburkholderia bannensis]